MKKKKEKKEKKRKQISDIRQIRQHSQIKLNNMVSQVLHFGSLKQTNGKTFHIPRN